MLIYNFHSLWLLLIFLSGLSIQKTSFATALPSYPPKSPSPSLIPKQQSASSPTSPPLFQPLTLSHPPPHPRPSSFQNGLLPLPQVPPPCPFLRLFILLSLSPSLLPFLITSSCSFIRLPQCVESSWASLSISLIGSSLTYAPIPNQSESATLSCPLFLCHQESLKGRYLVPSCFLFLLMKWVSSLSPCARLFLFADDILLLHPLSSSSCWGVLQDDLNLITSWLTHNSLSVTPQSLST